MKLKICGIRNKKMLQACIRLKIDFIGINFVKTSKRLIDRSFCNNIAKTKNIKKVGIFQNQTIEEIIEALSACKLDIIQLHGQETTEFIDRLKLHTAIGSIFPIWKAFSVDQNLNSSILQQYSKNCDFFLFDSKTPGHGSQILDNQKLIESIIESEKLGIPYGIAGGINSENIQTLTQNHPKATLFDTASGVEENGIFSEKKLEQLIENFI